MMTVHLSVHQYCALRSEDIYTFEAKWDITPMMVGLRDARGHHRSVYRLTGTRGAFRRLLREAWGRPAGRKGSALSHALGIIAAALGRVAHAHVYSDHPNRDWATTHVACTICGFAIPKGALPYALEWGARWTSTPTTKESGMRTMNEVVSSIVACYVSEHGAVPREDQRRLCIALKAALYLDLGLTDRSLDEWTRERVEALVMGVENEDGSGPDPVLEARWPETSQLITRWSE